MNQYLTTPPVFSRIESRLILSALLVGLLILTACGSAAVAPTADITRLEGELRTARTALTEAETAQETAERLQKEAETAQAEAIRLQGLAETARDTAITTRDEAVTATSVANTERGNAITARDNAVLAEGVAEAARLEAVRLQGVAETDRDTARTAEATAKRLQGEAETARDEARNAETIARTAETTAKRLQGEAETARDNAIIARNSALSAQSNAETARDNALSAQSNAETARDNAIIERNTARGERDDAITERNTARDERDGFETDLNAERDETTRLNQFIRPTYATWELFVNPETVPNTSTRRNQFLQTTANVISRAETNAPPQAIQTLNLATTTFDGLALDGESADGVAFFRGQINGINYNYAGIFEGTDLGRPLTDTTGSAIWNGSFGHVLGDVLNSSTDFTLHIAFDTNGGTLDAFVIAGVANNNFIFDNVRFDTRGLITGEVLYVTPLNDSATQTSTLRGVIGEQGAVGAFVGEVGADIGGAFVAHPTAALDPNIINFADWAGAAGNAKATVLDSAGTGTVPLLNGAASVDNTNPRVNFLQGLATVDGKGFNIAGTGFPSATVYGDVLLLEAGSPSGVAFSLVTDVITFGVTLAGLLPGTTLGAPITDTSTSAIWDAKMMAVNGNNLSYPELYSNPSFKMQVIFNNSGGTINSGTLSGQSFTPGAIAVPYTTFGRANTGSANFNIQGRFGSDGLLYGTVLYDTNRNGTLTGLIGVNGAVGAFLSDGRYAGGFVAKPPE